MKKHIPNTITCLNLISGCIATYWAFQGNYDFALIFIVAGAVFDFFDGMAARLLGVSSPIGKELDSLADVVTFGVAPSAMVFSFLKGIFDGQGPRCMSPFEFPFVFLGGLSVLAFIMAAFSALRLAKFNLDVVGRGHRVADGCHTVSCFFVVFRGDRHESRQYFPPFYLDGMDCHGSLHRCHRHSGVVFRVESRAKEVEPSAVLYI